MVYGGDDIISPVYPGVDDMDTEKHNPSMK